MPEIKVKHNVKDAQKPLRTLVEEAEYEALIANVSEGTTNQSPPRLKITIEYQILKRIADGNETFKGRRIYQDYVIEPAGDDNDAREAWRLKQVLEATKCKYDVVEDTTVFNTDHLVGKPVKIEVTKRNGKLKPEDLAKPVEQRPAVPQFNNVNRVDSLTVNEDNLV